MKTEKRTNTSKRPLDLLVMLRKRSGLSQSQLANLSGLSPAAISLLEKGDREPSLSTALKISKALNISIYVLIGEVEYPNNEAVARIELTKAQQKLKQIINLAA